MGGGKIWRIKVQKRGATGHEKRELEIQHEIRPTGTINDYALTIGGHLI